ncbi:hypothetical protein Aduo_014258 [Ancylostoma duodenale]
MSRCFYKLLNLYTYYSRRAFYLLSIAYSEASIQKVPDCKKKLHTKAIQNHPLREKLAVEVLFAKAQSVQDPAYTCDLERKAFGYVNIPPGGPTPTFGNNVVYSEGLGRLNLEKVIGEWKAKLQKMGRKTKFGCNLKLSLNPTSYKIACVFR